MEASTEPQTVQVQGQECDKAKNVSQKKQSCLESPIASKAGNFSKSVQKASQVKFAGQENLGLKSGNYTEKKRKRQSEPYSTSKKLKTHKPVKSDDNQIVQVPSGLRRSALATLMQETEEDGTVSKRKYRVVRSADQKFLTPVRQPAEKPGEVPEAVNELEEEKVEAILTTELEFEAVIDPNYKERKNFAILKLTEGSAKRCSSSFVATPLQPYSVEDKKRDQASKDAMELLDKGFCLVANTANVRRTLESTSL